MTTVDNITLSVGEARDLSIRALESSGTSPVNSASVSAGVLDAELSDMPSHGFHYVPLYCEHVLCGKVDGQATPTVDERTPSSLVADARTGFAYPAIDAGFEALIPAAQAAGVAGCAVTNSYNCGLLGYHVRRLAENGLIGMGFTNSPKSMAPVGGTEAVLGTNPMALAVPAEAGEAAFVIDQSSSVIAKSELMRRRDRGEAIPEGWALDRDGLPTTDPAAGVAGTMVPMGGHKGFGQALIVEVLAAALSASTLGLRASSFATNEGGPRGRVSFSWR